MVCHSLPEFMVMMMLRKSWFAPSREWHVYVKIRTFPQLWHVLIGSEVFLFDTAMLALFQAYFASRWYLFSNQ